MAKIVMFTRKNYEQKDLSGGQRRYKELILELGKRGHKIILISPFQNFFLKEDNIFLQEIVSVKSKFIFLPNVLISLLINFIRIGKTSFKKHDVTLVFDIPNAIVLSLFNFKNINLFIRQDFIRYRTLFFDEKQHSFRSRVYLRLCYLAEKIVFRKSKKIIVQSRFDKNELIKRHKQNFNKKIIILNNNVNPSWVKQEVEVQSTNNNLFKFVFIGNNSKRKGVDVLVEACKKLKQKERKKIELTLVGNGIEGPLIEGLKSRSIGYIDKPYKIMKEADLIIVPSREDSFPNVVLEALFLEIPVIGARVGGIPEILKYEELLFEPNVESLKRKMGKIIRKELPLGKLKWLTQNRKEELCFDWVEEVEKIILS